MSNLGYNKQQAKIVQEISNLGRKHIETNFPEWKRQSQEIVQAEFFNFDRPPIDTGESFDSVVSTPKSQGNTITNTLEITTPYAIYFMLGLGSNKGYGPRNPLKQAFDDVFKALIKLL